jgi:hypothetical protein
MKVTTATLGNHDYGDDAIVIYLDDGTEIGAHCIVDNSEQERQQMENMLNKIIDEAKAPLLRDMKTLHEEFLRNPDYPSLVGAIAKEALKRNGK